MTSGTWTAMTMPIRLGGRLTRMDVDMTLYISEDGAALWAEPVMSRLWAIGQTFINEYSEYEVMDTYVKNKTQITTIRPV